MKVSICVFTCEKFSSLWGPNLSLIEKNFPSDLVAHVFFLTDKETTFFNEKKDVTCISSEKGNDFLSKLALAVSVVDTDYFLFMLDDYFFTRPINADFFHNLLVFAEEKQADYIKLFVRTKRILNKKGLKYPPFYQISTELPYGIDLYPGLWKTCFAREVCENWPFNERSIWYFEGKMNQTLPVCKSTSYAYLGDDFYFLDVIRKGKLIRKANHELQKLCHIDLTNSWSLRSLQETFSYNVSVFLSHHLPRWVKKQIKAIERKRGKIFYSDN